MRHPVRRWKRNLAIAVAGLLAAAAVFLIPTIWGKPWSIEHLYARVFLAFALERPMLLSRLRILEPYGIDFHADDLDDFSVAFRRESLRKMKRSLETLRRYDRERQTPPQRLSTDVLGWFLETLADGERFLFHDYPVNQMNGVQSGLPDFMINIHQVRRPEDAYDYVARLSKFGTALDQVIEGLRFREGLAVVPPRFVIQRVREQVREFLDAPPDEHVLYASFAERLAEAGEVSAPEREALLASAAAQIEGTVYPAYERLDRELERLQAVATGEDGVWKLPDGEAYYAWLLRQYTTTNRGAEEIHALGRAEVERIHGEMRSILEQEGFETENLSAAILALHRDPRFLYPREENWRSRVLGDYQAILDDATRRLPELFGVLPRAPVSVERVPEFREDGAPGAYYNPPPFDGSRPGIFYANLRSLDEIPRFSMRTLAYHEAIPGHHLQIAIAQELQGVPFFRRVLPFTAYVEGWALYAERLAAEQGFNETVYDRFGQLVAEVFRAVRLVVDTGIHAKRWTRERAIEYMLATTGKPRGEVVAEVERYIVLPGQACAYKVGQLEILRYRERAQRTLGDAFDLREFHDVVLGSGALPLTLLERRVDDWLAAKKG